MGCYAETLDAARADRRLGPRALAGRAGAGDDRSARPRVGAEAAAHAVAAAPAGRRAGVGRAQLARAPVDPARRCVALPEPDVPGGRNLVRRFELRLTETVREWLTRHGQAPRLCELFWEPLALAALNQSIDQAAASYFVVVLEQMFGPDPSAAALVMPAVPLDELYAEPARAWLEARGHEVRVNAPAKVDLVDGRVTGVRVRGEHIAAPVVISTVPWHGLQALFDDAAAGAGRDHCQRIGPREPADRDREPVVRSAGDARAARRPARPRLPVGVRPPRHRRRRRVAPVADLERRGDDRGDGERRADRDWRWPTCATALPAARTAARAQGPGGAREALDVLAGARRAAAAAGRDGDRRASCWPATGSTPACRRRSNRPRCRATAPPIGTTKREATKNLTNSCTRASVLDDLNPRPLLGGRPQGEEPPVVHRPAGPPPAHGAGRPAACKEIRTPMGRIEIVLGPRGDRRRDSRAHGRACSASPTSRWRPACRSTSTAWPRRSSSRLPPRESVASFRVYVRRADQHFADAVARPGARPGIEGVARARLEGGPRSRRPGDQRRDRARRGLLLHRTRKPGAGGLPTGTAGRVAALLSGGIDSPVAAWRMMKRGCHVTFVHFHSEPFLSNASQEKARELAEVLTRYQLRSRLYPGAVRRAAAAGDAERAGRPARHHLPAVHAAHRRAHRPRRARRARWSPAT